MTDKGTMEEVLDKVHEIYMNMLRRDKEENEFPNTAICHACGRERHVNTCGFCEKCWITFSFLRGE